MLPAIAEYINTMENSAIKLTWRSYPYVKPFWQDYSGYYRWTISNDVSITLTAALTLMLGYGLGRLLWIVYTIVHFSFLDAERKTFVDDQVCVIAINSESPSGLGMFLFHQLIIQGRHALKSRLFQVVAFIAIVFWCIQLALIVLFGNFFLNDPIPYSLGLCGSPNTTYNPIEPNMGVMQSHRFSIFQAASMQFENCIEIANIVTCPAPAGQTFSYRVLESAPDYCWFGPEYCYNGSRTISLQTTIRPRDLGTLRHSPMSLTLMTECSHVNNTDFVKRVSKSYHYDFGKVEAVAAGSDNTSLVVFDLELEAELLNAGYRPQYIQSVGTNEEDQIWNTWDPVPFLAEKRDAPFLTENTTAPSSLTIIFNRLFAVTSFYRNDDPFFLTEPNPNDNGYYLSGQIISTLACRDRYRLEMAPTMTTEAWSVSGNRFDIDRAWRSFRTRINSDQEQWGLDVDNYLLTWNLIPTTIGAVTYNLGVNALRAQRTLMMPDLQLASPTTKIEVTRWFGIAILNILNAAYITTSGRQNNWDFGTIQFPDMAWVCDGTLRFSTDYTSVKLVNLITVILLVIIITGTSYGLQPLLGYWASRSRHKKAWKEALEDRYVSLSLHGLLQLHRIAVEKSTHPMQEFDGCLDTIPRIKGGGAGEAPIYGGRTPDQVRFLGNGEREADIELGSVNRTNEQVGSEETGNNAEGSQEVSEGRRDNIRDETEGEEGIDEENEEENVEANETTLPISITSSRTSRSLSGERHRRLHPCEDLAEDDQDVERDQRPVPTMLQRGDDIKRGVLG